MRKQTLMYLFTCVPSRIVHADHWKVDTCSTSSTGGVNAKIFSTVTRSAYYNYFLLIDSSHIKDDFICPKTKQHSPGTALHYKAPELVQLDTCLKGSKYNEMMIINHMLLHLWRPVVP